MNVRRKWLAALIAGGLLVGGLSGGLALAAGKSGSAMHHKSGSAMHHGSAMHQQGAAMSHGAAMGSAHLTG